jgi:hypothetical protein
LPNKHLPFKASSRHRALPFIGRRRCRRSRSADLRSAVFDQLGTPADGHHQRVHRLPRPPWHARFATIAANIWRGVPFVAITLLAGLQTILPSLYEA